MLSIWSNLQASFVTANLKPSSADRRLGDGHELKVHSKQTKVVSWQNTKIGELFQIQNPRKLELGRCCTELNSWGRTRSFKLVCIFLLSLFPRAAPRCSLPAEPLLTHPYLESLPPLSSCSTRLLQAQWQSKITTWFALDVVLTHQH